MGLVGPGSVRAQAPEEVTEDDDGEEMPDLSPDGLPQAPVDSTAGERVTPTEDAEPTDQAEGEIESDDLDDLPDPIEPGSVPTPRPAGEAPLPEIPAEPEADGEQTLPGQARNLTEEERTRRGLLWIPRIVFAPVRFSLWLVTRPIIALAKLNRKYQLINRFMSLFVSDDGTYGLIPSAFVETGFGLNGGLRAYHRNLFGKGESISARIGFGGFYNQRYQLSLSSGNRSSHVTVEAGVRYVVRRADRFFGVGTGDREDPYDTDLPLSVYDSDQAVRSRYRRKTLLGELALRFPMADRIWLRLSNTWVWSRFDTGDLGQRDPWINQAYEANQLVGFFQPQTNTRTELRLVVDRRRQGTTYMPPSLPSEGAWFQVWGGWQQGVRQDPSQFGRVGADVDGFINLYEHDRVLRLRARFEAVVGHKENIPFDGWALLEGPDMLRGFSRQRFRSRYSGLGTVEYRYPIAPSFAGYLFTDVGIAANHWEQAHPRDWHFGYGGGLMMFSKTAFVARIQVAASREGIYFNLRFAPANDPSDVL